MDSNEREMAEKQCVCKSGASLDVLGEVHRAYEARMEQIERNGGPKKLQMQVQVLTSWVSDLVAQNTLLVRAVQQLERDTAARITAERRRHAEVECEHRAETAALRRRLARKDSDLRGLVEVLRRLREQDTALDGIHFFEFQLNSNVGRDNKILELSVVNESLQQDVSAKDREIKRLNMDLQQYEQAMSSMRDEMNPNVPKKDAEVMAGMCCTGTECGDLVPVQDIGELLQEETRKYKERIQKMETNLKSSAVKMRAVHKINLSLIEELSTLRRFCVAVDVERRDARLKLDLEGQIVKQLVRQLRQAKEMCACVATSTPNNTRELPDDTDISTISPQVESPVTISDAEVEEALRVLSNECHQQSRDVDVHEQSTLKLDTPDRSLNPRPELVLASRKRSKPQVAPKNPNTNNETVDSISEKRQSPRKRKFQIPEQNSPRKQSETPIAEKSQTTNNQLDRTHSSHVPEASQSISPSECQFPEFSENDIRLEYFPKTSSNISKNNLKVSSNDCPSPCDCVEDELSNLLSTEFSEKKHFPKKSLNVSKSNEKVSSNDCPSPCPCVEDELSNLLSTEFSENKHFPKKSSYIILKNKEEVSSNDCPSPCPGVKDELSNLLPTEFSEKDIRVKHFPKKSLNISKSNEKVSSNNSPFPYPGVKDPCSCHCEKDEQSNLLPTTSEKSTFEKNKWWLISPDEIKKNLEAIRQSFLGKIEDGSNILFKSLIDPPCALTRNNTENTSNLDTGSFPSSSSNIRDIPTSNFRTDIKIRIPRQKEKCDVCDSDIESEEDENGHQNNRENQDYQMTQKQKIEGSSKSPNQLASSDFNVEHKRKKSVTLSDKINIDEDDNVRHEKNIEAKDRKKTDKSQVTESQFFRDLNIEQTPKGIEKSQKPCNICDPSEECKEDDESYYQKKKESNLLKNIPSSSNLNFHHTRKSSAIKHGNNECGFCDEECEEGVDGCQQRNSEKTNRSQAAKAQSFKDDSAVKSRRDPLGNENDPSYSSAEPRRIVEVKIVTKELQEDSRGGSSCPGGCERYFREKLMATLQILENKDETIRIQGSSLGVAEGRIAELSKRASALQAELEHKASELNKLRQFAESCRADKSDVSITAEIQEAEAQKHMVESLEDNLSVIAELYRECFYETAKQEELIEMLRKSYLDVRLMENDKADKITRLQHVINTQKRSIEQCQDVVIEVESLKSEISSFLSSSNNDSGMWERGSDSGDVGEELADILDQLRQLQDMLTGDCTCGLDEEHEAMKERNASLEKKLELSEQRNGELEGALRHLLDQQYEKKIAEKERELQEVHKRLAEVENDNKEKSEPCETLTRQLQQAQVMLTDKSAELAGLQQSCAAQEATIKRLEQELARSEKHINEGLKKLAEASQAQVEQQLESQAVILDLEQRLQRVSQRCQDLEMSCREKQSGLEEAHARGARLCEESRRVAACVREWMRSKRQLAREQQEKIERQESMLRDLQRRIVARQNMPELTSQSETDPSSSNSIQRGLTSDTSYPRCSRMNKPPCRSDTTFSRCGPPLARCIERDRETTSCSKCEFNRQCESEMASCSKYSCAFNRESASGTGRCPQAPVPPRRQKKQQPREPECPWAPPSSRHPDARRVSPPSPTQRVLERLDRLQQAMEDGQRRWSRPRR